MPGGAILNVLRIGVRIGRCILQALITLRELCTLGYSSLMLLAVFYGCLLGSRTVVLWRTRNQQEFDAWEKINWLGGECGEEEGKKGRSCNQLKNFFRDGEHDGAEELESKLGR